eukprot:5711726-Pyramimonas_sp.AAC.1
MADAGIIQQNTASTTIIHITMANARLARAKKYAANVGLYCPKIPPPLVTDTVANSSGSTSGSSRAQEAVPILLGSDKRAGRSDNVHPRSAGVRLEAAAQQVCHIATSLSHKAKR